jgi:hypothetical protein
MGISRDTEESQDIVGGSRPLSEATDKLRLEH